MSSQILKVFEHTKLRYDDASAFKKHHFDAMVSYNERQKNKYFTIIHNGVLFNSYVGVIQVGQLVIEILPKADSKQSSGAEELWQGVLLKMLRECNKIKIERASEASLKKRHGSLLDVYFGMFLQELENLIKNGLIKKYRRISENQFSLKGKLIFAKNIRENIVHRERFFCEHQEYNRDHLIHQIILAALLILKTLVSPYLRDRLNRVMFHFEETTRVRVTSRTFDSVVFNRKNKPYIKALDIAKMIILNYAPNINAGKDNMLAMLFDMNELWEEYICRILQKHSEEGVEVYSQNKKRFWESKNVKPDIYIRKGANTYLIDTKWKIVMDGKPSDEDLKQMFVYNLLWDAEKSMLLYPKTTQVEGSYGNFHFSRELRGNKCKLGFVNVVVDNKLVPTASLAAEIFNKLDMD